DCFAARPDFPQGEAPRVLERMRRRLGEDPLGTVTEFRRRCGGLAPDRPPHLAPLAQDLERLIAEDRRGAWQGPLLVIHGAQDTILPPALQAAT
ncbi:hypothetical protein, partial [Parafrigoribacterium mesophilum]|uniref:hypothetical protein n=1 Tax=Parafrigoribacterium mesophilum TaxID=433646 RepID=UPI0031FCE070